MLSYIWSTDATQCIRIYDELAVKKITFVIYHYTSVELAPETYDWVCGVASECTDFFDLFEARKFVKSSLKPEISEWLRQWESDILRFYLLTCCCKGVYHAIDVESLVGCWKDNFAWLSHRIYSSGWWQERGGVSGSQTLRTDESLNRLVAFGRE